MTLPADPAARNDYIRQAATQGGLDVQWVDLDVSTKAHSLVVRVTRVPVACDGVYFGAGAMLEQQVADALGALLLTPKLIDLMFAAAEVVIPPFPLTSGGTQHMMDTATFVQETNLINGAIAGRVGLVQTVGKPFVLSKLCSTTRGTNYGWSLPKSVGSNWKGVAVYPSVTLNSMVIQQPGNAHGLGQDDYASTCLLAHRNCTLDGQEYDLAKIYTDPSLAGLVSHEGALPWSRQPGVPVFACPAPSGGGNVSALAPTSSGASCPLPPPPLVTGSGRGGFPWGLALALGGGAALVGGGWWWLSRR